MFTVNIDYMPIMVTITKQEELHIKDSLALLKPRLCRFRLIFCIATICVVYTTCDTHIDSNEVQNIVRKITETIMPR